MNITAEVLQVCFSFQQAEQSTLLHPTGTRAVLSAATQENTARTSEGLAWAPAPESADEESDGAAPAGTTCAAAGSSPASSHPCAHHTSSEAARTPVMT